MQQVRSLIISLGLMLVAQVALAGDIQHFTDRQGVLHITNTGGRKPQIPVKPSGDETPRSPGSSQKAPSTALAPESIPLAAKPAVEPRLAPEAADELSGGQVFPSEAPPGAIPTTPGLGGEGGQGKAAGALKRIAWTAPPQVQAAGYGEIVCYKDRQQVIPITNLPPDKAGTEVPVKAAPGPPTFQPASWPLPEPLAPPPRPPPLVTPSPDLANQTICRYRDSRGVWHITTEPAPGARPPLTQVAAAAVPSVAPVPLISTDQRQSLLHLRAHPGEINLSCSELGPEVVAYIKAKLSAAALDLTQQTIRSSRDSRDVWRITNESTLVAGPPQLTAMSVAGSASLACSGGTRFLPSIEGAHTGAPLQGHAPPLVRPADLTRAPGLAKGQPQTRGPTVIARRDRRGVLQIFTLTGSDGMIARGDPASFLNRVSPFLQAIILEAAHIYGLPVTLVLAIIRNESNFTPQAISPKGAMGLMQLMPRTATSLGVEDPFSPRENVLAGCRHFRSLLNAFQGSVPLALAAYNAGSNRVISAGWQIPAIKETQDFVSQVMGLYYYLEKPGTRL